MCRPGYEDCKEENCDSCYKTEDEKEECTALLDKGNDEFLRFIAFME